MKKLLTLLFIIAALALTGCGTDSQKTQDNSNGSSSLDSKSDSEPSAQTQTLTILDTVNITLPADWNENANDHPFDLQFFSSNHSASTGVFLYDMDSLAADNTPQSLFTYHIEQIGENRTNFKLESELESNIGSSTIVTHIYTGESNASANYYMFSLVEFEGSDDIAIIMQTCLPEEWDTSKPVLIGIVESCALLG